MCDLFAKGQIPGEVVQAIKLGRMTALQKEGGASWQESHGQDDRPAVGPSGEGRHKLRSNMHCRQDQDVTLHMHFKL